MYRVMKTLINLLALVAIVFVYVLSANLFMKGDLLGAYLLVISAMASIVLWINKVSQKLQKLSA
jgi:hypothetical protein